MNWQELAEFSTFQYAGRWFEIYHYFLEITEGCLCSSVKYTVIGEKSLVKFCCTRGKDMHCLEGEAVVSHPNKKNVEGRLNVSYYDYDMAYFQVNSEKLIYFNHP